MTYNTSDGGIIHPYLTGNFTWSEDMLMKKGGIAYKPEKILALIMSITSILANTGSLIAIAKIRGTVTANMRLIISLCCADIVISISVLILIGHSESWMGKLSKMNDYHTCISLLIRNLRSISQIVSLLNLLGLAMDHYFAIVRPLTHVTLMSKRRANIMVALFWIAAILLTMSDFYVPIGRYSFCENSTPVNFCEAVYHCSTWESEYILLGLGVISFLIMAFLYTRIFFKIKKYQSFQGRHAARARQNRRGLITTFIILATFAICWLPYCLFEVIINIRMSHDPDNILYYWGLVTKYDFYLFDLLLLNCLCDPVIYAVRMREVQKVYRRLLRPCLGKRARKASRLKMSIERHSSNASTLATRVDTAL